MKKKRYFISFKPFCSTPTGHAVDKFKFQGPFKRQTNINAIHLLLNDKEFCWWYITGHHCKNTDTYWRVQCTLQAQQSLLRNFARTFTTRNVPLYTARIILNEISMERYLRYVTERKCNVTSIMFGKQFCGNFDEWWQLKHIHLKHVDHRTICFSYTLRDTL